MSSVLQISPAEAACDLAGIRAQLAAAPDAATLRPLGIGQIVLGRGVVSSVPDLVRELCLSTAPVVALLADCRPMAGASSELKDGLTTALRVANITVRRITVGDAHARVHADAATIEDAANRAAGADVLVSVGSGNVVDVGKAVSASLAPLPHVAVQTAGSVNGFADDQSVLLVNGVKRTTPTAWPDRLVIDVDVIAQAPASLNRAGLGDLLASYTAPADWLLASLVGQDDSYSPIVVALTRTYVDAAIDVAPGIGRGEPGPIATLAGALALSGMAMGVSGRTAPGSGMEHTVSHLLEMSEIDGRVEPLHGAKVGALSILSALLWQRVRAAARAGGLERLRWPTDDEMRSRVDEAFAPLDPTGATAAECWRDYSRKLTRWRDNREALETLERRWPAFDGAIDGILAAPERLVDALRRAGAPVRLSDLGIAAPRLRWALTNCHLMRDRFTVADLAFFMGMFEAHDVDVLLDDAAKIGAGA